MSLHVLGTLLAAVAVALLVLAPGSAARRKPFTITVSGRGSVYKTGGYACRWWPLHGTPGGFVDVCVPARPAKGAA